MAASAGEDKDVDAAYDTVKAFLKRLHTSATRPTTHNAAYGTVKAVLERLHAPVTRPIAQRLLGAVSRRFAASRAAGEECFCTFHFLIHYFSLSHLP